MKRGLPAAVLVLLSFALGACATTGSASSARTGPVSCLVDPGERGTRPLILFFCIQNP